MIQNTEHAAERMKELIGILREAAYQYYQMDHEIMSNKEYDALYDELVQLEKESGTILSGSPTQMVGYEVRSALPKVTHESPMLSLDKTKDREALAAWLGNQTGLLSWKMDGLTVVLTYEGGSLNRGGDHCQCAGFPECSFADSLSGGSGAAGRSGHELCRVRPD